MTRRLPSNHDIIFGYQRSAISTWNMDAAFVACDQADLPTKTADKYSHRDSDGRLYRLDNLINPNADRPNLTYEFLGVTKVWRWTRSRMQEAYEAGLVVQTATGRVPQLNRYLDEQRGLPLSDVWSEIAPLNSQAAERLGYPTQKPVALLERLINLTTDQGAVVLDPFCGCGTTIDAAIKLKRRWIGIDVTYIAVDLIEKRLIHTYGDDITGTYDVNGIPRDTRSAQALFEQSAFDFERWAVSLAHGQPNERQVGDKGIDGVVRFNTDNRDGIGRVLVSVKGGKQIGPQFVRDLLGTVETQKAEMGLLILMSSPTHGMNDAADHGGTYRWPVNQLTFPRVQIITVEQLLAGQRPVMPPAMLPYIAANRRRADSGQLTLDVD